MNKYAECNKSPLSGILKSNVFPIKWSLLGLTVTYVGNDGVFALPIFI